MSYSFFVPLGLILTGKWSWMWELSIVGSFFCSSALLFPCVCPPTSPYTWRGQSASSAWRSTLPSVWDSATPGYVQSGDNRFRMIGITVTMVGIIKINYLLLLTGVFCMWWTGQQHEGHTWTTLPCPERLYLWQGGIPYSCTARLFHPGQSDLHLPSGSQLPLRCLQDWKQRVCTSGQLGWSQVYQTIQRSVLIFGPEQLHDLLLTTTILLLRVFKRPIGNCVFVIVCHFQIYF